MAYTSAHKENTTYNPKSVWNAVITRLKTLLHAFEIETSKKISQIQLTFHSSNGYPEYKADQVIEEELERRNKKLEPLGTLKYDAPSNTLTLTKNFTWMEIQEIPPEN